MGVASPAVQRRFCGIVIGIIVLRHIDRGAISDVAVVFLLQRIAVVFEVIEDIQRAMRRILDQAGAGLIRCQQRDKAGACIDLGLAHLGPAADGNEEIIGKPAQQGGALHQYSVVETAKCLGGQHLFCDAVEMPQHGHAAPADAKGGMNMGLGPVHHLAQFIPVGDIFERQVFDRGTGDDQAIEFLIAHVLKRPVEFLHMRGGGVARLMIGHADQMQVDLQGGCADQAGELIFGLNLFRHRYCDRR